MKPGTSSTSSSTKIDDSPPPSLESFPVQTLLRMARQRADGDEAGFEAVFVLLSAERAVRHDLQRFLSVQHLTDLKFCTLVVLFALDPEPSTPADIAYHTAVSRSAITDVLDRLEQRGVVRRQRDSHDRRTIYVYLTAEGRTLADRAIGEFLRFSAELAGSLDHEDRRLLVRACAKLRERSRQLTN